MRRGTAAVVLAAALAALPVALPAAERPAPTGDALIDSLMTWHAAGRPDLVDSLAGPAVAAARAAADTARLLPLLLVRGADRAAVGDVKRAEPDLREARALAAARGDTLRELQTIRWLCLAVGRQGRTAAAAALFRDLETLAAAAGDSVHLGWAWVGQAYDHYLAGRSVEAAAGYGRAAATLERAGVPDGAIWAWSGRGLALRQGGRFLAARAAFRRALDLATANEDQLNRAVALSQLGRLEMLLGDPGRAIAMSRQAVALFRARHQDREGLVPCLDIAAARVQQGRLAEAAALLDSARTVSLDRGLGDLALLSGTRLADVRLAQDRPGTAARVCRELLTGGEAPSRMALTELRLRLARALAARDSAAAAAALLEEVLATGAGAVSLELAATADLGACRLAVGDAAGAVAVLAPAAVRAREAGLDESEMLLLTRLGLAHRRAARPDSARAVFARAVAVWERQRARPDDLTWREHRGAAGQLFAAAAANLLEGDHPDLAAAFDLVQRYKARTLQERMLGPEASRSSVPRAPRLVEVRTTVLRPGEVLLDLVEGEDVTVLFCVSRDTATAARLPGRTALERTMRLLGDVVTSAAVERPDAAVDLAREATASWPPDVREALADAASVTWCPDGSWHRFPLALLLCGGDESRGPDGCLPLARVPSTAVLARLRAAPRRPAAGVTMLAVCGPAPDGSGPLPGAEAETRRLQATYRRVRRTGVTGTAVSPAAWRDADILHLAVHTRLDPWQPWNTSVSIDTADGGTLRAAAVADLDLRAGLAVLSGCTTAGDRVVGGEGLIGLAGGFLAARVPAVVATLWPVDDGAAARFTGPFYAAMAKGRTVAEALALARAACRADPATAAPRHWAGFVVVGDGATTTPLQPRSARWPWALALLLAAGAAWRRAVRRPAPRV